MPKAKVLKSGNSPAVLLPKKFRFDVPGVVILRRGQEVVLQKPKRKLEHAFDALASMPRDFMSGGRKDRKPQKRSGL